MSKRVAGGKIKCLISKLPVLPSFSRRWSEAKAVGSLTIGFSESCGSVAVVIVALKSMRATASTLSDIKKIGK